MVEMNPVYATTMTSSIGYVFGGVGMLLSPTTLRIGRGNFEVGFLTESLGAAYLFRLDQGPGYVGAGIEMNGPYTSLGFEWEIIKLIRLRGEFACVFEFTGYLRGDAILGVELVW